MDRYSRRRLADTSLRRLITGGGLFIIASILTMLAFLLFETIPLWKGAHLEEAESLPTIPPQLLIADLNEYQEVLFGLDDTGRAGAWSEDGSRLVDTTFEGTAGQRVTEVVRTPHGEWVAGTDSAFVIPIRFDDGAYFDGPDRKYRPSFSAKNPVRLDSVGSVLMLAAAMEEEAVRVAAILSTGRLLVLDREVESSLFGDAEIIDNLSEIDLPNDVAVTSLTMTGDRRFLYLGTEEGVLLEYNLEDGGERIGSYAVSPGSAISELGLLLGGNSVVVGTASGEVEIWFRAADKNDDLRLIRAHQFEPHEGAVVGSAPSLRNRSFLTWDATGELHLHYGTTAQTRARLQLDTPVRQASIAPKSDGIAATLDDGSYVHWALDDPHPEVSARTLFGKVHYERFNEPEFKWQSTGGTDESETKLSLVPLIFGSLKGTLYAMLFSAPIAVLAALYTSVFMHARLRAIVKPTMELMATIPSVVLGLLAGLWLAPRLQSGMPVLLFAGLILPSLILLLGALSVYVPDSLRRKSHPGTEALILVPIVALGVALMVGANGWVDGFFEGGFLNWLFTEHQIRYDQRNALVVGIAMGMAVIPIIFSVSEDSLSSVPRHLTAGSLALGATPWQTAWRVVLPAASPGIFSALMIGFGRAVGETMIILMATGNTPIMDWSLFNGFRTLSANIAVEIPEAPHGGSLYRILFVSALLLFLFTLVVNTTAEVVSTRLRKRYSRF